MNERCPMDNGETALVAVLLAIAFVGMAFTSGLATPHRYVAYIFLAIGAVSVVASLIVLAAIPATSASALPGVPTWLSVLIPATLFLVAGGINRYENRPA